MGAHHFWDLYLFYTTHPLIPQINTSHPSYACILFLTKQPSLYLFHTTHPLVPQINTSHPSCACIYFSYKTTQLVFFLPQSLARVNYFSYFCSRNQTHTIMTIKTTELIRTSQSWDGAILPDFPQGRPELRVIRLDFPIGAKTGWHHHTVVNYGIVQQGELTIVCQDGSEKTFYEGEALVEVIGTIHRGENRGRKPVILNMFYFSSPDQEITIQHPEMEHEQKHEADKTTSQQTPHLVPKDKEEARVYKLVLALGKKVLPRRQLVADVGLRQKSRCIFVYNYWKPCWERGLIDFAYASVPNKPEQAYRLTAKGLDLYAQLSGETE